MIIVFVQNHHGAVPQSNIEYGFQAVRSLPQYIAMFVRPLVSQLVRCADQKTDNATSTDARLPPGDCTVQYTQLYKCMHCLIPPCGDLNCRIFKFCIGLPTFSENHDQEKANQTQMIFLNAQILALNCFQNLRAGLFQYPIQTCRAAIGQFY